MYQGIDALQQNVHGIGFVGQALVQIPAVRDVHGQLDVSGLSRPGNALAPQMIPATQKPVVVFPRIPAVFAQQRIDAEGTRGLQPVQRLIAFLPADVLGGQADGRETGGVHVEHVIGDGIGNIDDFRRLIEEPGGIGAQLRRGLQIERGGGGDLSADFPILPHFLVDILRNAHSPYRPATVVKNGGVGDFCPGVPARGPACLADPFPELGALLQAAKPPHKEKILAFVRYLTHQLDKLGVTVRLGQAAAPEAVAELHPYAVLVAAGASPLIPSRIPGIHGSQVYTASDLLTDKVTLEGQTVVVIGAGMTGLETAEYLKSKGNRVSVYDLLPEVAHGEHFQNIIDIEHRLGDVPQYTSHKLVEIAPDSCIFETEDGTRKTASCDAVILAMGMRPNQDVAQQFAAFPNCHTIGTCVQYGNIAYAVESGFLAASQL